MFQEWRDRTRAYGAVTAILAMALTAALGTASTAAAQGCAEGQDLCGFVWDDSAHPDGIQNDDANGDPNDGDQSGLDEVKVSLYVLDSTNTWVFVSETTTSFGFYNFGDVPDGEYKIVVSAPQIGMEPAAPHQGTDIELDSDGVNDAGSSVVSNIIIGPNGVPSQDLDFGFQSTGVQSPGTGTPGYWKNHPEAWAASSAVINGVITIGGRQYLVEDAIAFMGKVAKDKTITIFSSLLSAKLNVGIGNDSSCIGATIAAADLWMTAHPVGSNVAASSPAWTQIAAKHQTLDDYNNGRLCAPHRK